MEALMTSDDKISEYKNIYPCGSEYKTSRIKIAEDILNFSINGKLNQDIHLTMPAPQKQYVSLTFMLSGKATSLDEHGHVHSVAEKGDATLVFHRYFKGSTILHKTDELSVFSVMMPYDFIHRLFKNHSSKQVEKILNCQEQEQFCQYEVLITPFIKSTLHQIQQSHFSSELQHFFIASKSYELICYCLEQFTQEDSVNLNLSVNDINCLKEARRILSENYISPPTIIQLARRVGINDCKLKRGFKELFNTTPFGYVLELRMMQAKHCLQNGASSVTSVANQVGYSNVGHFAAAFRKYHGTTPSNFKHTSTAVMAASRI